MEIKLFDTQAKLSSADKAEVANFLFRHLEQYGDPEYQIKQAIDYALSESPEKGGFILLGYTGDQIAGAAVVNRTGMADYIPDNLLVYLAMRRDLRGQGLGRILLESVVATAKGGIALHVESGNPALHLYQKIGFQNKYMEMRLLKS